MIRPRIGRWRASDAIIGAIENERGNLNCRSYRKRTFNFRESCVARRVPVSMPIRMDDHIDKVWVVKRHGRLVECFVIKTPCRGPGLPKQPAQAATIGVEPGTTAFGVEVPLVPEGSFSFRRSRLRRRQGVLNRVPADNRRTAHPLRMQCCGNARGPATPIIASNGKPPDPERVHKIDQVLAERGLLASAPCRCITEEGETMAAEVGHDDTVPVVCERRYDVVPCSHIIRKAVQQDHRKAERMSVLFKPDRQGRCLNTSYDARRALRPGMATMARDAAHRTDDRTLEDAPPGQKHVDAVRSQGSSPLVNEDRGLPNESSRHLVTRSQINLSSTMRAPSSGESIRNVTRFWPSNVNHRLRARPTRFGTRSIRT